LLVVIAIIAILISILLPAIGGARRTARKTATKNLMVEIKSGISNFRSQTGRLPGFFTPEEMGSNDNKGITQMENALVELGSGKLDKNAATNLDQVITLTIGSREVKIDVLGVASSEGGYLNVPSKGVQGNQGAPLGVEPALVGRDQVAVDLGGATKLQMPDVLDGWGQPIMLWMKNDAAGATPDFARENSGNGKALFYWRSNFGYLDAPSQKNISALGSSMNANFTSNPPTGRGRTMEALLGHPAFPDANASVDDPRPLSPRSDIVLVSPGPDGVFMDKGTSAGNNSFEFRYLPNGVSIPSAWNGQAFGLIDRVDDIILGGD